MTQTGYPFEFLGSNKVGADKYLLETLVYVFRSEKSGHSYQVNMEHYVEHLYGVKLFDMSTDNRIGTSTRGQTPCEDHRQFFR